MFNAFSSFRKPKVSQLAAICEDDDRSTMCQSHDVPSRYPIALVTAIRRLFFGSRCLILFNLVYSVFPSLHWFSVHRDDGKEFQSFHRSVG